MIFWDENILNSLMEIGNISKEEALDTIETISELSDEEIFLLDDLEYSFI